MERDIYYHDTDAGGVVYYANYLKYFEEGRTEYLKERDISPHGEFLYAVRQCNVTYKSPARYGDRIRCESKLVKLTAAQLWFDQKIFNVREERLLVKAEITLVSLTADFKPTVISDEIRAKLA